MTALAALARLIDRTPGAWPYRVRPYDMLGDRRRWWWEDRSPCRFSQGLLARWTNCPECSSAVLARVGGAPVTGCTDHGGGRP